MRILIYGINFHPEPTGTGKYTGEMAHWLAGRGHEVRVVTAPPSYPHWCVFSGYSGWKYSRERFRLQDGNRSRSGMQHAQCPDIEIFRSPIWVPENPNGAKRLFHLASFGLSSMPMIMRQVSWSPEILLVVEPTLFCAPQALLVARWSGAKAWLHIQDFEVDAAFELGDLSSSRLRGWALAVERRMLSVFDRVSAISERMVDRLRAKGVDPARCILFPNWVDTREIYPLAGPSPFRKELGITDSTVVALYAGSMGKKHGLHLLVDAARRLSSCPGLRFVFCGKGPGEQTFVESVKGLANVSLLPVQPAERLNDLLNLADIHLLPQLSDAADLVMPSKLTGMMASGRAIIATAHRGTELFRVLEGRGIVTPPRDVDAFVAALLRLVEEPCIQEQLGKEARRFAVSHLNRDEILQRFEQSMLRACGVSHFDDETGPPVTHREKLPVEERAMRVEHIGND
jgi:colanic acid biosynthesis glycosyl transferase WcaI